MDPNASRETLDHSIMYIFAVALEDGDWHHIKSYTKSRANYVYFSEPYRYEENSLFVMRDSIKEIDFESVSEFLVQVRLQNFNLGVTQGFIYADTQINLFINDSINKDIIKSYQNDVDALQALLKGEVDGFISDRVVGAAAILNSKARVI